MSITSDWPLPPQGIRCLVPRQLLEQLACHPLTRFLYPIAMGYYPVAYQHHMQRVDHQDYLLIYCTAGRGVLYTGKPGEEDRYAVSAGDIVVLPKHTAHRYSADSLKPWTIHWLHFDGTLGETFCRYLQLSTPCQHIGLQPRVITSFEALVELRNIGYQLPHFIYACHQLQSLLSYLSLLIKQQLVRQRPQSNKGIDLQHIESIMQQHIHTQLNLDILAGEVKLSKYHFSKIFKQLIGQSPIQYFINMKMQHACFLLDSSKRPVKLVSADLGYDDAYYFSRLFKKTIGLSPDQYRRSKYR